MRDVMETNTSLWRRNEENYSLQLESNLHVFEFDIFCRSTLRKLSAACAPF